MPNPDDPREAVAYKLAEGIVTDVRREKTARLNLSRLKNLTKLPNLSGLEHVVGADLHSLNLESLEGIELLSNLSALDLSFCRRLTDYSALSELRNLVELDLADSSVTDLSPLARSKHLRILSLAFAPIKDLEPLRGLTELLSLNIRNTPIRDLSVTSVMQSLRALNISHTMVADLSPLMESESLIIGAKEVGPKYDRHTFGGIRFTGCTLLEERIRYLTSFPKFDRTLAAINLVREQNGLRPYLNYGPYVTPPIYESTTGEAQGDLLSSGPPELPEQSPGLQFEISAAGNIQTIRPNLYKGGNDVSRLRRLLEPLREASTELISQLGGASANTHAHLLRRAEAYEAIASLPLEEIDFSLLYAAGLRLENAKIAADRDNVDGLSPPLEDHQFEVLKSLVTLHGIFILSSADGQALVAAAERMDLGPQEMAETTQDIIDILTPLQQDIELVDPAAAGVIIDVAADEAPIRHPARRAAYTYAATSNLLIVLGGYAVLGWITGGTIAGAAELVAGTALHSGLTQRGKDARYFATVLISDLADFADKHLQVALQKGGKRAREFLLQHEPLLRRLATRSTRFSFLSGILDWLSEQE